MSSKEKVRVREIVMGVELGTNRKRREPQSDDKMERKKKERGGSVTERK